MYILTLHKDFNVKAFYSFIFMDTYLVGALLLKVNICMWLYTMFKCTVIKKLLKRMNLFWKVMTLVVLAPMFMWTCSGLWVKPRKIKGPRHKDLPDPVLLTWTPMALVSRTWSFGAEEMNNVSKWSRLCRWRIKQGPPTEASRGSSACVLALTPPPPGHSPVPDHCSSFC